MANILFTNGFQPSVTPAQTNKYSTYTVTSGYGTALYNGDPVKLAANSVNGIPSLVIANAGDTLAGIFDGVEWTDNTGRVRRTNYWPAGNVATQITAFVYDNPFERFKIELSGAYAATDPGQLADFVAGVGNPISGSGYQLDSTTMGTGTGFRVCQVFPIANNLPAANAVVEVVMMKSLWR